jgi:hypothetical protein
MKQPDTLLLIRHGGMDARVVLVYWEHHHLVDIVREIGKLATVTSPQALPSAWPDDRFDFDA